MAAPSTTTLLGPPEIRPPPATTTTAKSDPFMDLLTADFNDIAMGFTENRSPTFLSTGNPCLDFFFHVVPDTPAQTLTQRLKLAWDQDPLKALKLVCNLRGVRGTGKADKEGYYAAALWLHKRHPKTLACNVPSLAGFGYLKDLPEILYRLLEGADAREKEKEVYAEWKTRSNSKRIRGYRGRGSRFGVVRKIGKSEMKLSSEEKRIEWAKRAVDRFNRDPDFKFLHERVSDLFAECLRSDMKLLESKRVSLAAKWCPSLDSSFDKSTLLCETIAKKVFPREEYPEYQGVEEAHYAYRVRDRLRKQVLVPLRKALELPEVFMGANDWGSIPYNRVASVAMKLYTSNFIKHDKERFDEYLENVRSGKAKINAGALLPHEIVNDVRYGRHRSNSQVAELQWKRIVDDMAKKGKLNNCLAVCDVSGSMHGIPMEVSVALGILVSELSGEPWKGKVITFSDKPKLQAVKGDSLKEKADFVEEMEWGYNTDFQKVFDVLLQTAVDGKLGPDQMIKRLFVFSDMEFDQASTNPWETDYQAIVRKFGEKGYGECVPEIVFWNLRDSKATPGPSDQKGVALVSGYSKNLMNLFLEENAEDFVMVEEEKKGGDMNPEAVMEAAISGEEYQKLVIID